MSNIHGIIACAGNGTRFAKSLGKPSPYPKHLEILGDRTILHRAVDGMVHNIAVDSITFTLNPELQNTYIDHLRQLQQDFPEIPFSYAPARELEGARLFTNIKETLKYGVHQLDGQTIDLGNPTVGVALGDSVITKGNKDALSRDIDAVLPYVRAGKSFAIFRDSELKGLMYWLSVVSELGEGESDFRRSARDYGLRWWNCNSREELLVAQRELGYYPVENEMNRLSYQPRKEAW